MQLQGTFFKKRIKKSLRYFQNRGGAWDENGKNRRKIYGHERRFMVACKNYAVTFCEKTYIFDLVVFPILCSTACTTMGKSIKSLTEEIEKLFNEEADPPRQLNLLKLLKMGMEIYIQQSLDNFTGTIEEKKRFEQTSANLLQSYDKLYAEIEEKIKSEKNRDDAVEILRRMDEGKARAGEYIKMKRKATWSGWLEDQAPFLYNMFGNGVKKR
ncbi:MAG: hypothetical protein ABW189_05670 [Rickettsiales bacterium]